ncbi:hypothetical protein [Fervidibacter sacchari]
MRSEKFRVLKPPDLKRDEGRGTGDEKFGRAKFLPSQRRQRMANSEW